METQFRDLMLWRPNIYRDPILSIYKYRHYDFFSIRAYKYIQINFDLIISNLYIIKSCRICIVWLLRCDNVFCDALMYQFALHVLGILKPNIIYIQSQKN